MMNRTREMRRFVNTVLTCEGQIGITQRVMDPDTLEYIDVFVPTWTGRCLVYPAGMNALDETIAETEFTVSRYSVVLPAGAPAEIGQRFQVTVSPDEPALIGLPMTLVDVPHSAWAVAQQCIAALVTEP